MHKNDETPSSDSNLASENKASGDHAGANSGALDPLRAMRALAKGLWANEDPDEYVRGLREGWD